MEPIFGKHPPSVALDQSRFLIFSAVSVRSLRFSASWLWDTLTRHMKDAEKRRDHAETAKESKLHRYSVSCESDFVGFGSSINSLH